MLAIFIFRSLEHTVHNYKLSQMTAEMDNEFFWEEQL